MKTITIRLTVTLTCGSLFLLGCSKSNKSEPAANNSSSPVASSANGGSAPAGPVALKLKWQTGKKYDMEMDMSQSMDMAIPGQPTHQETETKVTMGLQYSPLKDLDSGGHEVEMKITRQNLDVSQNGQKVVTYDSAQNTPIQPNSPTAPIAAAMQATLGVPLNYTLGADGSVEKVDGVDSLLSRIAAAVPDQRQRASIEQYFDQDTLKQYCDYSKALPDHPVNIGDSWLSSQDIKTPVGVVTVDSTYTFKDWEQHAGHNCVHLLVTGDLKTKDTSASTMGVLVKIQKGTLNGDVWFDPDLGMLVDAENDQDVSMNLSTRGMSFSGHQKQNIQMSLLGVNP